MKKITTLLMLVFVTLIGWQANAQGPLCGEKFYDTGGENDNYLSGEDYSLLIVADDPANIVTLDFLSVDIESGFDFLRIYDGDDNTAPELSDPGNGVQAPGSYSSSTPGANLFITFTSDGSVTGDGWDADVLCAPLPTCDEPQNFVVANITTTTADLSWDAVANATNGYIASVFAAGADPMTDTAVYTEMVASGTVMTTATGLMASTLYDAYIVADCDADGLSTDNLMSFGTEDAPPACDGLYLDTGGLAGNYSASESTTTTITPDNPGEIVTVTFTYVDIESSGGGGAQDGCWDFLTVYDGPDTASPVLAMTLCGEESGDGGVPSVPESLLSIGDSFTSTHATGALTFVFTSDTSVQETGWSADITCSGAASCDAPANFTADATTDTSVDLSWDEETSASNGYNISIYLAGADPMVDPTVATDTAASGATMATVSGLAPATDYDAYIEADCDVIGVSDSSMVSFTTEAFDTVPVCGGKFYDTGGPVDAYQNDEDYSFLITADDPANIVTLNFLAVNIESGFDFLRIYDGDDNTAPELSDPGNGVQAPGEFSSSLPGGNLFVTFTSDGSVTRPGWDADVVCAPPPTCEEPENYAASNIMLTSADLAWDAVANATNGYLVSVFEAGADPMVDPAVYTETVASGTVMTTATGLMASTSYDAYIQADCGVTDGLSTTDMISFTTLIGDPECGGKFYDTGGPADTYQSNEDYSFLITVDDPANIVTLDFLAVEIEDNFDFLRIYDGDDNTAPELSDPALGVQEPGSFSSSVGGNLFVTFTSDGSVTQAGWDADVICDVPPTCPEPLNFMVTASTNTTADFSWDEVADATNGYILSVFDAGADPMVDPAVYTEMVAAGTLMATATGLMGATPYDAYIQADCDAGGLSTTDMLNFSTQVDPPVCGGKFYDTGGPDGDFMNDEDYSITITPDVAGDVVTATFLFVNNTTFDILTVDVGDGVPQVVPEIPVGGTPEVYISSAAGGELIFNFTSSGVVPNAGWDADITCGPPPSCPAPGNFAVTATTDTTADFSWNEVANATNGYILDVFEAGADPMVDPPVYTEMVPAGTLMATATGLMQTTAYDAYLQADCDAGDLSTVEMISFNTSVTPPACGGKFYDTGGPAGTYQNNEDYSYLIVSDDPANAVMLNFLAVEIEDNFDFLRVYDGDDATAPELSDPALGVQAPGMFSASTAGGNLFVTFTSDGSVTQAGWDADVICAPPPVCENPENFAVSNITETTADLSWDAVTGATSYAWGVFEEGADPLVDTPVAFNLNEAATAVTATGLTPDTAYDAYIRTNCGNAESSGDGPINFNTSPLGVNSFTISSLVIAPNPTSGILNISSQVTLETITIANVLGQQVLSLAPNAENITIDISTLASGTYFVRATANGSNIVKKIIKE